MPAMKLLQRLAVALALFLLVSVALSDEGTVKVPAPKVDKPPVPPTVKVEKGLFQATVSLKGVFTAAQMTEVVLRPEAWAQMPGQGFSVLTAVEPGTRVKKGDVLVTLQMDKIDRAIRDVEAEQQLAQVAIRLAEEELPVLEKSTPVEIATAERNKRQADEDLKKFLEVDRPLAEATAENGTKNAQHFLDYAKEELKQLQKMYRNKDLTEETEEIILKRQRHQVEMSEFSLKTATIKRDQVLKVDMPRQEQTSRDNVVKQTLALEKARGTLPLTLNQKHLALEKLKYDADKAAERLQHLKKDREAMTVKAPTDGIVYHGRCVNGQWNSATVTPRLQRGGVLMPEDAFMTVVSSRPLLVQAVAEEKDLHWLKSGMKAKVVPTGYPDVRLPVELASLGLVLQSPGNYGAIFKVDAASIPENVMPGMACTVKVVAYRNETALSLPSSAVFSDDDEDHYVYRTGGGDKVVVKVGKTAGDRTEILDGLKEGDEVRTSKP
jgi:multidrug efflux pump subunit AcrA (membrane-fusion protein)